MAANEYLIYGVKIDSGESVKKLADLKKQLAQNAEAQKQLAYEFKQGQIAEENYREEAVKLEAVSRSLNKERQNEQRTLDLVTQANKAQSGSYEKLLREHQLAQTQLKLLAGTLQQNADGTYELTEEYLRQSEAVEKAKTALISFDQKIKDGRTNVGLYNENLQESGKSMRQVVQESGLLDGALGPLGEKIDGLTEKFEQAKQILSAYFETSSGGADALAETAEVTEAVGDATKGAAAATATATVATEAHATAQAASAGGMLKAVTASKVLKVALAATGIGAILLLLGSLVSFLTSTQEGMDLVARATNAVSAVFNVFKDRAAGIGKALAAFATGNFSKGVDQLKESTKGVTAEISREIEATDRLTKARQRLRDDEVANMATSKRLLQQIEAIKLVRDNEFNSIQKRTQANEQAYKLELERNSRLSSLQERNLDQLIEEANLRANLTEAQVNQIKATSRQFGLTVEQKKQLKLTTEEYQRIQEVANELADIQEDSTGKQNEFITSRYALQQEAIEKEKELAEARKAAAEAELARQVKMLQSEKAAIETRLLSAREGSFEEVQIREELARKQLEIDLKNTELSKNERILAEAKVNQEIDKLWKERAANQKQQARDLNNKLAQDSLAATNKAFDLMELNAKESLANRQISEEGYNRQIELLHYQRLQTQLSDLQQYAGTSAEIDQQIAEKQVEIANYSADQRIAANNKVSQDQLAKSQQEAERLANEAATTEEFLASIGAAYSDALTEQGLDTEKFAKNMLLLVIDTVEKIMLAQVAASIGTATVQSFAQPDAVASFGATGVVRAALLAGLIKAAFTVFKGAIAKFEGGGILDGPSHANGGIQLFNKSTGAYYGEAEGGEPILTKAVSQSPSLLAAASAINVAAGGKPLTNRPVMVDGGLVSRYVSAPVQQQADVREIINQQIRVTLESMPQPVLLVEDFDRVKGRKNRTEVKTNL